jgi:hypothetical protein
MKAPRPLADLVEACLSPALAAQGFASSDVVVAWPEIVGERLAGHCRPVKLQWPRRNRDLAGSEASEPAVLVVKVEGAFALELQHLAPLIVERVNGYFGWRCVGRLSIKQGPVEADPAPAGLRPEPDPESLRAAEAKVGPLEDERLRRSLARLGALVMTQRSGS